MNMDPKTSIKYQQTEFGNTLKGAYTITKWDLILGCKNGLTSTNQSMFQKNEG